MLKNDRYRDASRTAASLACALVLAFGPGINRAQAGTVLPACDQQPPVVQAPSDRQWAKLGRDLFYDPILSGNRTVACATCHHPVFGTSDAVSLALGDGGIGLGPNRRPDPENMPEQRIPRNAPALFNLGFAEFSSMFHDGRVERLAGGGSALRLALSATRGPSPS